MDMKQVYEALEKVENGAELITAIKTEVKKLNDESKNHRTAGEKNAEKLKKVLEGLGLEDNDEVETKVQELKDTLETLKASGNKPDEVAKKISNLTKQVETLTKNYNTMTETAANEKAKRLAGVKTSKLVELLTKGNAAAPNDMAKLLDGNVTVKDDESMVYVGKDGAEVSLDDGVNGWLKDNAWAVKVNNQGGSGSNGGGGGTNDPFLAGFNE